jgi:hypothetical protein
MTLAAEFKKASALKAQSCPRCGQPLSARHGVALSPMRLRVFDLIERRPGISSAPMVRTLYPGQDLKRARRTLFTHVTHINEQLEATNLRIARFAGGYRLVTLQSDELNT